MNDEQRQRLVDSLNETGKWLSSEPGFIEEPELRAAFMVIHTASAAILYRETMDLAELCSGFCEQKASMPKPPENVPSEHSGPTS